VATQNAAPGWEEMDASGDVMGEMCSNEDTEITGLCNGIRKGYMVLSNMSNPYTNNESITPMDLFEEYTRQSAAMN